MKSFYQFYEQISVTFNKVYVIWQKDGGVWRVYDDYQQAIAWTKNPITKYGTKISGSFDISMYTYISGPLPPDGSMLWVLSERDYYSHYGAIKNILTEVYTDRKTADAAQKRIGDWIHVHPVPFIRTSKSLKIPSTPKSPYANLKYPLISELAHYLSLHNLNQEVYQTMRDKSQKSINLLNNLRTLIKKIELT